VDRCTSGHPSVALAQRGGVWLSRRSGWGGARRGAQHGEPAVFKAGHARGPLPPGEREGGLELKGGTGGELWPRGAGGEGGSRHGRCQPGGGDAGSRTAEAGEEREREGRGRGRPTSGADSGWGPANRGKGAGDIWGWL
jgi:hypothetical protein